MVRAFGGSMRPLLPPGTLLWIDPRRDCRAGDVAAYQIGGRLFIHRLVKGEPGGWRVAGDAASVAAHHVPSERILGPAGVGGWRDVFCRGKTGLLAHHLFSRTFRSLRLLKHALLNRV